jgi:hypothetical protein
MPDSTRAMELFWKAEMVFGGNPANMYGDSVSGVFSMRA